MSLTPAGLGFFGDVTHFRESDPPTPNKLIGSHCKRTAIREPGTSSQQAQICQLPDLELPSLHIGQRCSSRQARPYGDCCSSLRRPGVSMHEKRAGKSLSHTDPCGSVSQGLTTVLRQQQLPCVSSTGFPVSASRYR